MSNYQMQVNEWMEKCFDEATIKSKTERSYRFIEEAVELVQALGLTRDEVKSMVDYVFDRPIGDPEQEVGGVMVTLAALCNAVEIDVDNAGTIELMRAWTVIDRIRERHKTKPHRAP